MKMRSDRFRKKVGRSYNWVGLDEEDIAQLKHVIAWLKTRICPRIEEESADEFWADTERTFQIRFPIRLKV